MPRKSMSFDDAAVTSKSFTVDANVKTIENRLAIGMEKLGYKQIANNPLRFERGSKTGWLLGAPPSKLTTVEIRMTPVAINRSDVTLSYVIAHRFDALSHVAVFDGIVPNPLTPFWVDEMDLIKGIAKSEIIPSFDSYNEMVRELVNRRFIGMVMAAVVFAIGMVVLAISITLLGLSFDPTILQGLLLGLLIFAAGFVYYLAAVIYQKKRK